MSDDGTPTNGWFQRHVLDGIERLETEVREHRREFRGFKDRDFAAVRDRVTRLEVRAGLIAALVSVVVTAVVGTLIR